MIAWSDSRVSKKPINLANKLTFLLKKLLLCWSPYTNIPLNSFSMSFLNDCLSTNP